MIETNEKPHRYFVIEEIRTMGTSREWGEVLVRYGNLLRKAKNGDLGSQNIQLLMDTRKQLEEAFGIEGALAVYSNFVAAIELRSGFALTHPKSSFHEAAVRLKGQNKR